jgi:acyl-CoA thioesterase FadM
MDYAANGHMHWLRYLLCVLLEVRIANAGKGSHGGLLACLMTKHAVLHAAQNPKTKYQTDVRSAHIQFYRPIFPAKDPRVQLHLREVNIGKGWSTFRVELTQGSTAKVAASADVMQVSVSRTPEQRHS